MEIAIRIISYIASLAFGFFVIPMIAQIFRKKKNIFEIVKRFLVFPRRLNGSWRWLQWAYMWKRYNEKYSYMDSWATREEYVVTKNMHLSTDVRKWSEEDHEKIKAARESARKRE